MIIFGIDPGLAHTGWGVIETRGSLCRARAYGCIVTKSDTTLERRLKTIHDEILEAIHKYSPSALAIEKIFFGENSRSALATAHARGAAMVACAEAGVELGEYTPMQIKQAVVGTGAADKRQVIYMVRNILNLDHEPRPDHAADALAAAICHAHLTRTQRVAMDVASVAMAEQLRAQKAYEADLAREITAAATAAHIKRGERDSRVTQHVRQSRRNS